MMDLEISNKFHSDSSKEKGTTHQQDMEEEAMMVWETLDDSTIDNAEEQKPKPIKENLRM